MATVLIVIVVIGVVAAGAVFFTLFKNMVFVAETTEGKLKHAKEAEAEHDSVVITEMYGEKIILERKWEGHDLDTGDIVAAREMLLTEEGELVDDQRFFDSDPRVEVDVILDQDNQPELIFRGNQVFYAAKGRLGELKGEFKNPAVSDVRHVTAMDDRYFIMIASSSEHKYVYTILWQVDRDSLEKVKIAEDMYYTFSRPPMLFRPAGFNGYVLVYYTESLSWGFGGDSSRPKFSHVRIYNEQYPQGRDLARFGFKAGTIVDVEWKDDALLVTGDTNRPLAKEDQARPARIWKIGF